MNQITDVDEDSNKNFRSLNSDNKNGQKSNRKIRPIQYGQNNLQNKALKLSNNNED